jgi:hypothetical protein
MKAILKVNTVLYVRIMLSVVPTYEYCYTLKPQCKAVRPGFGDLKT